MYSLSRVNNYCYLTYVDLTLYKYRVYIVDLYSIWISIFILVFLSVC